MNLDHLNDDEIRTLILKKQIEYIKLCQDNFLLFVKAMWPDFIIVIQRTQKTGGTIKLLQMSFKIYLQKNLNALL